MLNLLRSTLSSTAAPSSAHDFPRLGQLRFGERTYAQTDQAGIDERARLATCDLVFLGLYTDGPWDEDPVRVGYLSRADVITTLEDLNNNIVIYDYIQAMETTDGGVLGDKLDSETGPTGNGGGWTPNDWWSHTTTGARISTFPSNFNTNLTAAVTLDGSGRDYADFFIEQKQISHIDPHATVGEDGINIFLDNVFQRMRVNSPDHDRDGSADNGRSDPDGPGATAWRLGTAKVINDIRSANTGMLMSGNITEWFDESISPVTMKPEYVGILDGGVCEGVTNTGGFPFSRVFADSSINPVEFGSWALAQAMYTYGLDNTIGDKHVSYVCSVVIDDVLDPGAGTNYSLYRWTHCSALLENGYYHVSNNTGYSNTPQFDEMGTINQGTTGLSKGWLSQPIDGPQRTALHGTLYGRKFEGGWVFVNTSLTSTVTINVPGDLASGTHKFIDGVQDSTTNDGTTVTANIVLDPIDGIFLEAL